MCRFIFISYFNEIEVDKVYRDESLTIALSLLLFIFASAKFWETIYRNLHLSLFSDSSNERTNEQSILNIFSFAYRLAHSLRISSVPVTYYTRTIYVYDVLLRVRALWFYMFLNVNLWSTLQSKFAIFRAFFFLPKRHVYFVEECVSSIEPRIACPSRFLFLFL